MTLKVAIIGLGTVSPIHRIAIENSPHAQLVAVCDIDKTKKSEYSHVNFYTDIDEMIAQEKLDCVHICLPHFEHFSAILKCAEAGINVFTEKPLTLNYEEAVGLFNIEKTYNIKLGVCLQNRYNNTSIQLKSLMHKEEYGKFLGSKGIVTWNRTQSYYDQAPWRGIMSQSGGGVIINQSIHTLDLLSYLGGEFEFLQAKIMNFTLPETEIEDTVVTHLKYKEYDATSIYFATIGYCSNSDVEIDMVFEKAVFKIREGKLYKSEPYSLQLEFICEDKLMEGSKHYYGASHVDAIQAFLLAIINNTKDYVSVQEGAYSLKILENIVKSSEQQKQMII